MSSDMSSEKSSVIRYVILTISMLLSTSIQCNQQALSFTVICMQDVVDSQATNETASHHWLNDPAKKNALFSIVAVGQLIGIFPIVPAMQRIGLRSFAGEGNDRFYWIATFLFLPLLELTSPATVSEEGKMEDLIRNTNTVNIFFLLKLYIFTFYGLVTACATLFLPLAVDLGHIYVAIARMLQGFSVAIAFVTVGAITSQWSVHRESGSYIAMLSAAAQLSSTITMPLASAFCESSLGWRYLYYTFGASGVLLSLLFFVFYKDDPRKHRLVSSRELSAITLGKEEHIRKETVPYKEILKDRCIQAVFFTTFSGNTAFFIFLQFGPTYMNMALGFDVSETGFVTALPYAISLVLKFVAGPLFDLATFIPEKYRMIMFASISQGFMSLCFCVLSQTRNRLIAQIAYTGAIACNGLNIVGSIKCAQVVARQHVHFVIVCITLFGCIISFILPVLVTIVCPNNTVDEWSHLFVGVSVFVIITNIPFLFLARSEPAPWTRRTPKYSANLEQGFRSIQDEKSSQGQKFAPQISTRSATQKVSDFRDQ